MTQAYEIPFAPRTWGTSFIPPEEKLSVVLAGKTYKLRFLYIGAADEPGTWIMDISDAQEVPLVCGIPLLPGQDLLGQYRYLGIGVRLFVVNDLSPDDPPSYEELGATSHLRFDIL